MAKVKIEFNLPDEEYEYALAMKARSMMRVMEDYDNWLRSKIKWPPSPDRPRPSAATYQEARDYLNSLCQEHKIDLFGEMY